MTPRGWISVSSPNARLENIRANVPVEITSPGATVQDVELTVHGEIWAIGLRHVSDTKIMRTRNRRNTKRETLARWHQGYLWG